MAMGRDGRRAGPHTPASEAGEFAGEGVWGNIGGGTADQRGVPGTIDRSIQPASCSPPCRCGGAQPVQGGAMRSMPTIGTRQVIVRMRVLCIHLVRVGIRAGSVVHYPTLQTPLGTFA